MSSNLTFSVQVFCTLQVEGVHQWSSCSIDEVMYLRDTHRHIFFIEAHADVSHSDRDIEFIELQHKIRKFIYDKYWDSQLGLCRFENMSCEMIALELLINFNLTSCKVSEDNENGSIVTRV